MLNENHNLKNAIEIYLKLLNSRAYFDAHEVLEEVWHILRKENHPQKNLVKGLINGAICFEHIKRNREDAFRKARQVLNSFERHKHLCIEGIEHFELFTKACKKIEDLKKNYNL